MSDAVITRWWFVRHAPVVGAEHKRLSGQMDVPADVSDKASFDRLAGKLPKGAHWITSHLSRTKQTAEALQDAGAERKNPKADADFAEQAFGAWTNLTWDDIGALPEDQSAAFWDAPATTAPPPSDDYKSESFASVCARVGVRLEELLDEYAGRDIICVAHAGSIRGAVAHALGLSAEQALALDVQNTSLTRLDHISSGLRTMRGGSWRVVALNQI
ncbi:histidine phosphatase family protein [Magnetovibrio sp. PR-2]|uniref:histidine phosphatase family protein n=1 Tax=Magnetovibrio sp. PR-2 TaxID=3120356 RepID=UPI002FCDF25C